VVHRPGKELVAKEGNAEKSKNSREG